MNRFAFPKLSHLGVALVIAFAMPAMASDAVTDQLQEAYAPYRSALFKTNGTSKPRCPHGDGRARLSVGFSAYASAGDRFVRHVAQARKAGEGI